MTTREDFERNFLAEVTADLAMKESLYANYSFTCRYCLKEGLPWDKPHLCLPGVEHYELRCARCEKVLVRNKEPRFQVNEDHVCEERNPRHPVEEG